MENRCPWAGLRFRSPFFSLASLEIYVLPRLGFVSPSLPSPLLHFPGPYITYGSTWKLSLAAGDVIGLEFNILSYPIYPNTIPHPYPLSHSPFLLDFYICLLLTHDIIYASLLTMSSFMAINLLSFL